MELMEEVAKLKVETKMSETERMRSLFKTYGKCLLIGCSLQAIQQFIGINTAMYYGPDIIQKSGLRINGRTPDEAALILNIPLAGFNAIGTIAAIFVIDRLGRRYLMLHTLPVVALAWILVAVGMGMTDDLETTQIGGIISFFGLMMFLLFFSFGMSSTPWAVNAEIYPLHVIGTANSLATTVNWLVNFIVASVFLETTQTVRGEVMTYSLLAFFAFAGFLFVYSMVPETSNKQVEEILEEILGRNYQANDSFMIDNEKRLEYVEDDQSSFKEDKED